MDDTHASSSLLCGDFLGMTDWEEETMDMQGGLNLPVGHGVLEDSKEEIKLVELVGEQRG